jgi:hypothetical protein
MSERELTAEESEANRRDPQWGHPVQSLALHASHWLESAYALHPDRRPELDALSERLDIAVGDLAAPDDLCDVIFRGTTTDGEVVLALQEIVQVMAALAPLLANPAASN